MSRIPPEFAVHIPEDRVALYPAVSRENARLIVYSRLKREIVHIGSFSDIIPFLASDVIVLNDTKVLPVRLIGKRAGGGLVELLFITVDDAPIKRVLINPSRRLHSGAELSLPGDASLVLLSKVTGEGWLCEWRQGKEGQGFSEYLLEYGLPPLPPYIKRAVEPTDRERYQTVYAVYPGSLAAPTAGFHFTPDLMAQLSSNGSEFVPVTLTVGLGTFQPIRDDDITKHQMHIEQYHIPQQTATAIATAKEVGRAVTAIGTTSVRALEASAAMFGRVQAGAGEAGIFIYPPYEFKVIDKLVTNFHRPDSTLMQLMAALIGWEALNLVYQTALDNDFRFFSYGDSMLVL